MDNATPSFTFEQTIQLPGTVGGHGDWVTYDPYTQTIWLAQSPDNNVVVIDARTNTVSAVIPNIDNANGIAITPRYAFVADPVHNVVDVIDTHTYQVVKQVAATGTTLDSVTYVPGTQQIYVASDDNNVLDAISAKPPFNQLASYPLTPSSSGPDVATYAKGTIYIPDGKVVDAVDPSTGAILASPTLISTGDVKPGVYDPVTNHFLFGSTSNQIEVVSGNGAGGIGQTISTIQIAGSTDEAAIDVQSRLAFFGDKVGEVDVVNLDTNKLVATLPAETGMHTLTVDPRTHTLYVYENNRNVVDVWQYGNGHDFAHAGGRWAHEGSPGRMEFSAGGTGASPGNAHDGDWHNLAGALQAGMDAAFTASGSGSARTGALFADLSGTHSGVAGSANWSGQAAAKGILAAITHGS